LTRVLEKIPRYFRIDKFNFALVDELLLNIVRLFILDRDKNYTLLKNERRPIVSRCFDDLSPSYGNYYAPRALAEELREKDRYSTVNYRDFDR